MGRTGTSAVAPPPLPKVDFEIIKESEGDKRFGVNDAQARSYGFNDYSEEFTRPECYIRYIEPLESDLARQVEYDMDEQDQEWLDSVNSERKKEQIDKISPEIFEIIMDRLEKDWFDLTKNIPKTDLALPSEDSTCAICDDSEGENSNAIVFCDGCNLAVHQDCYGVPYIPEGQWLCRKCTVSPESPVSCILCPNEGGAFKQTDQGEWVHLLCAIWVPETRVANEVFMEPVTGVERINKQRWKLRCSVCQQREGACIQCAKNSCFVAFHATCARKEKLLLPMKTTQGTEPVSLTSYCERHLPSEQAQARFKALEAMSDSEVEQEEDDEDESKSPITPRSVKREQQSKSARAHAKAYHTGPPLVPSIIVNRLLSYIEKVKIRKKPDFILMCCRYWSLKREARRGAPLLKRLHLEPWTAKGGLTQTGGLAGTWERNMKLQQLRLLRNDLQQIFDLTQGCKKREIKKLKQAEVIYKVLAQGLFPHEAKLREFFDKLLGHDQRGLFKHPVTRQEAPDYFDIIKNPICWDAIEQKLDSHAYWDVQVFKDDVNLVFTNAFTYNKPGTLHHRTASRLQGQASALFPDLDGLAVVHRPPPIHYSSNGLLASFDSEIARTEGNLNSPLSPMQGNINEPRELSPPPPPTTATESILSETMSQTDATPELEEEEEHLGNLEPPISILELLRRNDNITDHLEFLIPSSQDPVSYLLDFTIGQLKPPPPTPTPTPTPEPEPEPVVRSRALGAKEKKEIKKEKERARKAAQRAVATAAASSSASSAQKPNNNAFDFSPGFRAPRRTTRSTVASGEHDFPIAGPGPSTLESQSQSQARGVAAALPPLSTTSLTTSSSSVVIPGSPAVVENIDKKGLFTHFETGWVLPEGSRRGNRTLYQDLPRGSGERGPPPRKKAKVVTATTMTAMPAVGGGGASSKLSKFSTPASENETLLSHSNTVIYPPEIVVEQQEQEVVEERSLLEDDDPHLHLHTHLHLQELSPPFIPPPGLSPPIVRSTATTTRRTVGALPETIRHEPDGSIVIEQLDTPSTRKQKRVEQMKVEQKMMREMRKLRLEAMNSDEGEGVGAGVGGELKKEEEGAGGGGEGGSKMVLDNESELSELSSEEGEKGVGGGGGGRGDEAEVAGDTKKTKGKGKVQTVVLPPVGDGDAEVQADKDGNLPSGTLVWARMAGYPSWPASVQNVHDPQVPPSVKSQVEHSHDAEERKYAVQFFDEHNTWGAFTLKTLKLLGMNQKLDDTMQKPTNKKYQRFSPRVQTAYKQALDSRI